MVLSRPVITAVLLSLRMNGVAVPPNDYARSLVELARVPTADALGIFEDWIVNAKGNNVSFGDDRIVWDFGTNAQYPVLCPIDTNEDGRFTSAEFGTQPQDIEGAPMFISAQPEFVVGEEDGAVDGICRDDQCP